MHFRGFYLKCSYIVFPFENHDQLLWRYTWNIAKTGENALFDRLQPLIAWHDNCSLSGRLYDDRAIRDIKHSWRHVHPY